MFSSRKLLITAAALCLTLCACSAREQPAPVTPAPIPDQSAAASAWPTPAPEQTAYIAFINVGKADAALISTGGEYYLVDTGTKASYPQLDAALSALGVDELAGVFISHTHDDHTGGLKQLCEDYTVKMLYCAELSLPSKSGEHKIVKRAEKCGLEYTLLTAGDVVEASGGSFTALAPLTLNSEDDNDNSLVLRFDAGGFSALFTGDMQFDEEYSLLASGADVTADVLKVGNHGNPDATSNEFAAAVGARVAVISTDTSEDGDSANERVITALSGADILLTQDAGRCILVQFFDDGTLHVEFD